MLRPVPIRYTSEAPKSGEIDALALALAEDASVEKHYPGGQDHDQQRHAGDETSVPDKNALIAAYTRTGGSYRKINSMLRDGVSVEALGELSETVRALDEAIEGRGAVEAKPLYRGMQGWEPHELGLDEGMEFTDPAFVSTSRSAKRARVFALGGEQKLSGKAAGTMFKIIGTKNTKALRLDAYGQYEEEESLLPRGTRFRVKKVVEGYPGEKLAEVTLEILQ